ncbi:tRNA (adenosine(37)-N6)-threonylcarbamoyltransferase complex ATPase subunit type 1 TsaE [Novipirellula caenicola]|uniref:tRNA threonylcarbamoyladenosine biosynthesis protein TsaE n=1 Tax=Novipirellula caenicola TaxID=1536901 RepID=A0ABP9VKB7_9BACT
MDLKNTNQPALYLRHLDLEHVDALARRMVDCLPAGISFGLVGTLGAGKTRIVQSIAAATGVDPADVTSPTFTLLQSHHGSITLHHLDAYRVSDDDEFLELGVEELFDDPQAWTLVEWADLVRSVMPLETVWIKIDIEQDARFRQITMSTQDLALHESLRLLHQQCIDDGWSAA